MDSRPADGAAPPGGPLDPGGGSWTADEPCPLCGGRPVSPQKFMYVMSFLLFTRHATYDAALCRPCATRQSLKELAKSALLGWWGIPWGLLTVKALWLNGRALARWSTVAPPTAALLALAGLSPPALIGVMVYKSARTEREAKSTGDWVGEETRGLVEKGNEKEAAGDLEGALEQYTRAHEQSPDSSVVNFVVAKTLMAVRRTREALPFAARAEALNPGDIPIAALHGIALAMTGDKGGAEVRARTLRGRKPGNEMAAVAMVTLFTLVKDRENMLRAADQGLSMDPRSNALLLGRLDALLGLGRIGEAGETLARVSQEERMKPYARVLAVDYRMCTDPAGAVDDLERFWTEQRLAPEQMGRLARTAALSKGSVDVRARIHAWLHEDTTSPDAWGSARPWFGDKEWTEHLDRYLSRRAEVLPALLRIQEMDPILDDDRILALADSARRSSHPMAAYADSAYFRALTKTQPAASLVQELESHVAARPSHLPCLLFLCHLLLEVDMERAGPYLEKAGTAADQPDLANDVKLLQIEVEIIDGQAGRALSEIERLPDATTEPPQRAGYVDLLAAEAAFHAGQAGVLDARLKKIGLAANPEIEAPALLLRWGGQMVIGLAPTYRSDVQQFLEHYGETLKKTESASAQAILLAEGVVDRAWARRAVGDRASETFRLVAAIKLCSESGLSSAGDIESLASLPNRGAFGARLARTIVARRRAGT